MKSRRKSILILAGGSVVLLATLTVFMAGHILQSAAAIWALAFLMLAEAVTCGVIWTNACLPQLAGQTLLRAGLTGAAVFYLAATLATALFAGKLADHLSLFMVFNVVIIAIFGILILLLLLLARRLAG
jgi:hypothetical protein